MIYSIYQPLDNSELTSLIKILAEDFNHLELPLNELLTKEQLEKLSGEKMKFLSFFTNRSMIKHLPNKKYSKEMFELVSQRRMAGVKAYVANMDALKEFGFDDSKDESFNKQYQKYLRTQK